MFRWGLILAPSLKGKCDRLTMYSWKGFFIVFVGSHSKCTVAS